MNLLIGCWLLKPNVGVGRGVDKKLVVLRDVALLGSILPLFLGILLVNLLARDLDLSSLWGLDQKEDILV